MNDIWNTETANSIIQSLEKSGVVFGASISNSRFSDIEKKLGALFPPELKLIYSIATPLRLHNSNANANFPAWNDNYEEEIERDRKNLMKIFKFDIEQNSYWSTEFGEKPNNLHDAMLKIHEKISSLSPLVRIYGHRYIPTAPHKFGNAVISIWQPSDVVYYGTDLVDYFCKEFGIDRPKIFAKPPITPRRIDGWSDIFST